MNKFLRTGFLSVLFYLVFAVQFNADGSEGGGAADNDADNAGNDDGDNDNSSDNDTDNGNDSDSDKGNNDQAGLDSFSPEAQKMIKDLRKENAKHRTKGKETTDRFDKLEKGLKLALGMEGDDQASPEDKINSLNDQNYGLEFRNTILEIAVDKGLNNEQSEYLSFLFEKEIGSDKYTEEEGMTDEDLDALIAKVKGTVGGNSGNAGSGSSSVDGNDKNKSPDPKQKGDYTVEQFSKMNLIEKIKLRKENEPMYNKLFAEAKLKRML